MQPNTPNTEIMPSRLEEITIENQFGSFSKLPCELQLAIWEFAIFPNYIEIRFQSLQSGDRPNDLKIRGEQPALISTCKNSRKVALKFYGERGCALSYLSPAYHNADFKQYLVGSLYYDRSQDIVYFPSISDFAEATTRGERAHPAVASLEDDLYCIRSLAIGGCLQNAWIPCAAVNGPKQYHYDTRIDTMTLFWCLASLLREFCALEELILVSPGAEELSRSLREKIEDGKVDTFAGYRALVSVDMLETQGCIEEFKAAFPALLKSQFSSSVIDHESRGVQDDVRPTCYEDLLGWWKAPTMAIMTEEEFKTRY